MPQAACVKDPIKPPSKATAELLEKNNPSLLLSFPAPFAPMALLLLHLCTWIDKR